MGSTVSSQEGVSVTWMAELLGGCQEASIALSDQKRLLYIVIRLSVIHAPHTSPAYPPPSLLPPPLTQTFVDDSVPGCMVPITRSNDGRVDRDGGGAGDREADGDRARQGGGDGDGGGDRARDGDGDGNGNRRRRIDWWIDIEW